MRVKKVEYIEDFKLKLVFGDNKNKLVDLADIIKKGKGMFLPLKKIDYFKQVSIDSDGITICWPNGADLSPDVLYAMGDEISLQKKQAKASDIKRKSSGKQHKRRTTHAFEKKIKKTKDN